MPSSETDIFLHFMAHVPQIYASNNYAGVGSLATNHNIPTGEIAKLIRFRKLMAALGDLRKIIPFFPQWNTDLVSFQFGLNKLRSETVS